MSEETRNEGDSADRKRLLGYVQLGAIGVAVLAAIYLARAPDRAVGAGLELGVAPKPAVRVIEPTPTDQPLVVELTGTVSLAATAAVRSEVSSKVVWISPKFRAGGSIAAGETVVRIDPADFELRVEAARAAVKEAEAGAWRERARGEHDARVFARDYPGLEVSERVRRLPSLAKREAQLLQAQVLLKSAQQKLERTHISLPFDSQVLNVSAELGELARPATRLGTVYRTAALQAEAPVEPRVLEQLAPLIGRAALVRADGKTYPAEVARVSAAVAPKSRLTTVFLKFSDDLPRDSLPRPGTFASVSIRGPDMQGVYVLPESAEQDRASVWVVENGKLRSHAPRTLGRTGAGWIVGAFDAADGVVLGTIPGARQGLAVEPMDAPSDAGREG